MRAGDFFFAGLFLTAGFFFAGLRRGVAWRRGDGAAVDAGSHDFLAVGFFAGLLAFEAGFLAGLRRGPVDAIDATIFAPRTPSSYYFLAAGFFFFAAAGGPLPEPARSRARSSRLALSMGSS